MTYTAETSVDETRVTLDDLKQAAQRQDPRFVEQVITFLDQPDPDPPEDAPEETIPLSQLRYNFDSWEYRSLPVGEARMHYRKKKWSQFLEQEIPLPPRLFLDALLVELYDEGSEWARSILLELIAKIPLVWGPWRAIKTLFKRCEESYDLEVLGAIGARLDLTAAERAGQPSYSWSRDGEVKAATFSYLRRRAWRYLRRLGQTLPELYPNAAVQFLRWYPETYRWNQLWIANHIVFHEKKNYGRAGFSFGWYTPDDLASDRAFPELWKRSPEPLFDLMLVGLSDRVIQFAIQVLRKEFRSELREIKLETLLRLGRRPLGALQRFVKELIEENPSFQRARFKELGLHDLMLTSFLESPDDEVRQYAIEYARDYAQDLPLDELLRLVREAPSDVQEFALLLLKGRDARKELGLDAIKELLLHRVSFELAQKKLREGFTKTDLSPEWLKDLLFGEGADDYFADEVAEFAVEYLEKEWTPKELGVEWFRSLLDDPRINDENVYYETAWLIRNYALKHLSQFSGKELGAEWIKRAVLQDNLSGEAREWLQEGRVDAADIGVEWVRSLIDEETWNRSPWIAALKKSNLPWTRELSYPIELRDFAIGYLRDTRRFAPEEVGLDWLLKMLLHDNETCRDFASEYLIKHFNPAHFARPEDLEAVGEASAAEPVKNPFEGKTFLFTGTLRSLKRAEAQEKVAAIDGKVAKSVTKKLDYLVIGDEGSPLYAEGKKGSKQLKAEKMQAEGNSIQIISETDWLRMISEGGAAKADVDPRATAAGFAHLWQMATSEKSPENQRTFAGEYIQARHPILGPKQTGVPLEGEQVIPRDLYRSKDFLPLLEAERPELRRLSVQICRVELRRWKVPPEKIFALCESPYVNIRNFVFEALLGPDDKEKEDLFSFPPEDLDPDMVFALCESRLRSVREVGLRLVRRHYVLLGGHERVIRLAESPDREVRHQAVKLIWDRYRTRATTPGWSPSPPTTPPSPSSNGSFLQTSQDPLLHFFRTVLFGIPPGRLEKRPEGVARPISSSRAKRNLIEVMRDVALEEPEFAKITVPLFSEFLLSRSKSESLGCLVALARLQRAYPELETTLTGC